MFGNDAFSASPFSATGGVSDSVVITLASVEATGFAGSVSVKGSANTSITGAEVVTATTAATAKAGAVVAISGVSATGSTIDAVTVSGKAVFAISGASASALTVGVIISGDALSFSATPTGLIASIGSLNVTANADVPTVGAQAQSAAGSLTVDAKAIVDFEGVEASALLGAINAKAAADVAIQGVSATIVTDDILLVGDEIVVDAEAVVVLPSISATTAVNTVTISALANVNVASIVASSNVSAVNAIAEAVVSVIGVEAVAISDSPAYIGDEVIAYAEAVVVPAGSGLTLSAGIVTVDTFKFDFTPFTEDYGRERTIYLNAQPGSNTVHILPQGNDNTVVLTEHDKNTITRIAA